MGTREISFNLGCGESGDGGTFYTRLILPRKSTPASEQDKDVITPEALKKMRDEAREFARSNPANYLELVAKRIIDPIENLPL